MQYIKNGNHDVIEAKLSHFEKKMYLKLLPSYVVQVFKSPGLKIVAMRGLNRQTHKRDSKDSFQVKIFIYENGLIKVNIIERKH